MPALAMMKPSRCSTISTSVAARTTRLDSEQNQLHQPRVLGDPLRERGRTRGRHDLGQVDAPAFGLGYDLLREHQHIAVAQRPGLRC